MISNYILETQKLSVKSDIQKLVEKKMELSAIIKSLGISPNQVKKRSTENIPERSWVMRDNCVKELLEIDKKLSELRVKNGELHREIDSEQNRQIMKIFREIFSQDQIIEIKEEAKRRMAGEYPMQVSFTLKDCNEVKKELDIIKNQAKEYANKLVDIRVMLTKIIQDGCAQFDEARFLKVISPLNRNVLPLDYITKIKQQHFVK